MNRYLAVATLIVVFSADVLSQGYDRWHSEREGRIYEGGSSHAKRRWESSHPMTWHRSNKWQERSRSYNRSRSWYDGRRIYWGRDRVD